MNRLSWLIYLADVVGGVDDLMTGFVVMACIATCVWLLVGSMMSDSYSEPEQWRMWRRTMYFLIAPVFFIGVIGGVFVPSRDTMYAITASEMGEQALNTETGGKAVKALNHWLDKQVNPTPTETKD